MIYVIYTSCNKRRRRLKTTTIALPASNFTDHTNSDSLRLRWIGWYELCIFCRHWFSNFFTKSRRLLLWCYCFAAMVHQTKMPRIHIVCSPFGQPFYLNTYMHANSYSLTKMRELIRDESVSKYIAIKLAPKVIGNGPSRVNRHKKHKYNFHCAHQKTRRRGWMNSNSTQKTDTLLTRIKMSHSDLPDHSGQYRWLIRIEHYHKRHKQFPYNTNNP